MTPEEQGKLTREIVKQISLAIPKDAGFCLLVFPIGDANGNMNYVSNAAHDSMKALLKNLLAKWDTEYKANMTVEN